MDNLKNIKDLVSNESVNSQIRQYNAYTRTDNAASNTSVAKIINKLFLELSERFTAFNVSYPTDRHLAKAKENWTKAFLYAGITTTQQINTGLIKCLLITENFPPSCGKFIELCRTTPEDLNLPSYEKAYKEAFDNYYARDNQKWSNKAIYHAAKETYFSENNSYDKFCINYQKVCDRIIKGEILEDPVIQFKPHETQRCDKETWEKNMKKLKQLLQ